MSIIETYTGKRVDIINPRSEDIDIVDIAHALGRIQRYGGHMPFPCTVAGHSMRVAFFTPEARLDALMHDAAEAYVGDMVAPLKHHGSMGMFRSVEREVRNAIAEAIGLPAMTPERAALIHAADMADREYEQTMRVERRFLAHGKADGEEFLLYYGSLTDDYASLGRYRGLQRAR